jgi:hypothetical protein
MRKSYLLLLLVAVGIAAALQSCRDDSYLTTPPPTPDQSFTEEFDTVSIAFTKGWKAVNVSEPLGSDIWQQGGSVNPWFPAFSNSGTYVGFIGADYTSTSAAQGIISNWLISPVVTMQNRDKISFYTKGLLYAIPNSTDSTDYANRLQVFLNTNNQSLNVGQGRGTGDFSTPLLDINPSYIEYHTSPALFNPRAYPANWTRFEVTVFGLNGPTKGRFAFRYFVENGGSNGLATGVGIDKVQYQSVNHK